MAIDMFLELDGIQGDSKDSGHPGELDVLAYSWGLSSSGTSTSRAVAAPDIQDLSLTVYQGIASIPMALAVASGRRLATAVLTLRSAGDPRFEFWSMTMSDVVLTSFSGGASGGEDRPTENVSLSFSKVDLRYVPQTATGAAGTPVTGAIDLTGGRVVATG